MLLDIFTNKILKINNLDHYNFNSNFPCNKMSRQLCFNTQTEQVCLSVTPLSQLSQEDILQAQGILSSIQGAANRAGTALGVGTIFADTGRPRSGTAIGTTQQSTPIYSSCLSRIVGQNTNEAAVNAVCEQAIARATAQFGSDHPFVKQLIESSRSANYGSANTCCQILATPDLSAFG